MNPVHLEHFYIAKFGISVPFCSGNPDYGVSKCAHVEVWVCCDLRAQCMIAVVWRAEHCRVCSLQEPVVGHRILLTPASSRDFLRRVVQNRACSHVPFQLMTYQLKRLLSLREGFLPQCLPAELPTGQFLHPECSGHDSPLNCLSLPCLSRAPQHPQQHLSCSGAVNYPGVGCNLLRFG